MVTTNSQYSSPLALQATSWPKQGAPNISEKKPVRTPLRKWHTGPGAGSPDSKVFHTRTLAVHFSASSSTTSPLSIQPRTTMTFSTASASSLPSRPNLLLHSG